MRANKKPGGVICLLLAAMMLLTACSGGPGVIAASDPTAPPTDAPTAVPTEAPTAVPTEVPTPVPAPEPNDTILSSNLAFGDAGELVLYVDLFEDAFLEAEDADALRRVEMIAYYYPGASDFVYEGKTLPEYRSDPAILNFEAALRNWLLETYFPMLAEKVELKNNGDSDASKWLDTHYTVLFYREWSLTQPEEAISAYNEAINACSEAFSAYDRFMSTQDPSDASAAFDSELKRLNALGYSFELAVAPSDGSRSFTLSGEISLRGITEFRADPNWAYIIYPLGPIHG